MGLLTNPNSNFSKMLLFVERHSTSISVVSFIMGIVVALLFAVPAADLSHKTYFSENALLPGLVKGEFNEERAIHTYLDGLKEEAEKYPNSVPFPWLEARLRQLGLEVHTHNFTLRYPLGKTEVFTGENVYAILRAPRASSTEALVLSVPYRPPRSLEQGTETSMAVLLAMAKFFRQQLYWAKDIIFLVTQHEQLGMQAWLEAYHQKSCGTGILDYGDLPIRAGSIQAAINLEIGDPHLTHFNIKVEGLNGQLPNLDLVNLVNRLCDREGVGQMFQNVEDHPRPDTWKGMQRSFRTLSSMALKQASGIPSGNHGLFHRFGIEAVTMEGVMKKSRRRREVDLHTVGRVVEGTFRSLNNLLERFHQSFFFYLLPSSSRYVSIGMYMPAFGFLAGGLLVTALGLWFQSTREEQEGDRDGSGLPVVIPSGLKSALPNVILAHLLGLLTYFLPQKMTAVGAHLNMETDDSLVLGLLSLTLLTLFMPYAVHSKSVTKANWKVLKCLALLELSALAFCVSLANFSLAYLVSLIYVPYALLASPSRRPPARWGKWAFSILAHPLAMVFVICCADTLVTFPSEALGYRLLAMCANATKRALTFALADSMIYGNNNYAMATVLLVPCWYLLYCLNFLLVEDDDEGNEEEKKQEQKKKLEEKKKQ